MKKLVGLIIIFAPLVILTISIITLITTSPIDSSTNSLIDNFAFKQVLFALIGILLALVVAKIDVDYLRVPAVALAFVLIMIFSLVFVLVLPRTIANTHRWFVIGPFTVQPSELIKPLYYVVLAYILTLRKPHFAKLFILSGVVMPVWSLVFLEPDAGTTLFYFVVTLLVVFVWASKWRLIRQAVILYLVALIAVGIFLLLHAWYGVLFFIPTLFAIKNLKSWVVFGGLLLFSIMFAGGLVALWKFNILKSYQKQRIRPFLQAYARGGLRGLLQLHSDPNPHVRQARIAIGSAGILGKGPWQGTQSRLRFLPEYTTDFIYAAFVEEFGLVGGFVVIVIYIIWFLAIFIEILRTEQEFYFLLLLAIFVGMSFQTIVNIGMNLGILPTKGMPLPFFSYGGSSLISAFIQLGIVYSIYKK